MKRASSRSAWHYQMDGSGVLTVPRIEVEHRQRRGCRSPGRAWLTSGTLIENLGTGRTWLRKISTAGRVALREKGEPEQPQDLLSAMGRIEQSARCAGTLASTVSATWAMEHRAFSYFVRGGAPGVLRSPASGRAGRLVLHVGFGMAAVLQAGFDGRRCRKLISTWADPVFRGYAFESAGGMLTLAEGDWIHRMIDLAARLGWIHWRRGRPTSLEAFLGAFPAPVRGLLAHGYGRLTYFKSHRLADAFRSIGERESIAAAAAARGVVAAYLMLNNAELGTALALARGTATDRLWRAYGDGRQNVLALLEWMYPGCLNGLADENVPGFSAARLEACQRAIGGQAPAFRLGRP